MTDEIKKLDLATEILMIVWRNTKATEIADALDILSAWRERTIADNGREGVGA